MDSDQHPLSLEILEARALFAGDAVVADAQFDEVLHALTAKGKINAVFDPSALSVGVYRLLLSGQADSSVTVNFDLLPSFVTSIGVTQFDSVKFEGEDRLVNLILSDVNSFSAPQIDVLGAFYASNVDKIEINSVSGYATIQGDRVSADITEFRAINLLLNVNALVLDTNTLPVQITFWNTRTVIALPTVPNGWDLSTFSGLDNVQGQLRVGSSDISGSPSPIGSTDAQALLFSEPHVKALLDRLELLYRETGGFDATTIRRIVAELDNAQHFAASATGLIPEDLVRRDLATHSIGEAPTSFKFLPSTEISMDIAVDASIGATLPSMNTATLLTGAEASGDGASSVVVQSTLRPVESDVVSLPLVNVTIDPEVESSTPQASVWGLISQLVERGMDLKQYLINQLAQELRPGERTGVLLVDPKPIRGANNLRSGA
jgi:hypothetical protein